MIQSKNQSPEPSSVEATVESERACSGSSDVCGECSQTQWRREAAAQNMVALRCVARCVAVRCLRALRCGAVRCGALQCSALCGGTGPEVCGGTGPEFDGAGPSMLCGVCGGAGPKCSQSWGLTLLLDGAKPVCEVGQDPNPRGWVRWDGTRTLMWWHEAW